MSSREEKCSLYLRMRYKRAFAYVTLSTFPEEDNVLVVDSIKTNKKLTN